MKVMFYADAPTLTTGYGIVSYRLGKELIKRGIEVGWASIQYITGRPIDYEGGKIYAGDMVSMAQNLRDFKPDILLHIRDNWVFLPNRFQQPYSFKRFWDRYGFKQVNYTPVQSEPLPPDFIETIEGEAHFTFTMTKWGRDVLIRQGVNADKVEYLYHGVDRSEFKNLNIKDSHEGKRFIFVGGNYDYRKNLPNLIQAFAKYREISGDKESKLYLHCAPTGAYYLPVILKKFKLSSGEVMFKDDEGIANLGYGVETGKLNALYNWADVYITMTVAEGFDMPVLEAESVGLPVILTELPVHRELFSRFNRTYFVRSRKLYPMVWGYEWLSYVDSAVELMLKVEGGIRDRNPELFKEFDWSNIADRFLKVIDERVKL